MRPDIAAPGPPPVMTLDGLLAIRARIAELTAPIEQPTTAASTAATSATSASEFGAAYASALGASGAAGLDGTAGTTAATAVSTTGKLTPPPELAAFGNGRIPLGMLAPIGVGDHRLWAPAANAFTRMRAAAAAEGVTIGVNDSYRSYDEQVDLARRKGLYSNGGLAAAPGTSNHGWGMSVDLELDATAQAWMRTNGRRFGFVEDVPREPWHWTYRAA